MYPSDFADCGDPVRYTLLAALCWTRQAELVDGLAELLIGLIHRINARAERRVEKELIGELANVPGKRGIFTRMVDAALARPDDTVREAVYPVVPGGVKTLSALARELKATERAVAERVRYQLRGSVSDFLCAALFAVRYRMFIRYLLFALSAAVLPGLRAASIESDLPCLLRADAACPGFCGVLCYPGRLLPDPPRIAWRPFPSVI